MYQLGGFFASQAQHEGAICSGAWLPLVLLCVWKLSDKVTIRWTGLLAVSIALTILSGFTATILVIFGAAGLVAVGLTLWRRPSWRFWAALAGGFTVGHGMTAVQLIPTYQLTGQSVASERAQARPERHGVMTKCTFCKERVDAGLAHGLRPGVDADATPMCALACIAGAITFGDLDDAASRVSRLAADARAQVLMPECGTEPRVYYLVD